MRFKGKENIVFWCEDIPRMEGISWQNSTNIKYAEKGILNLLLLTMPIQLNTAVLYSFKSISMKFKKLCR
jgi:hypothetical protein